jgi:hypothetical protein
VAYLRFSFIECIFCELVIFVDVAAVLYRPGEYWPDKPEFANWIKVIPVALRVGDRTGKTAKLGIDMVKSFIYEFPQRGEDYTI